MEERVRAMEEMRELKERQERRRNIMVKGIKMKKEKIEYEIKGLIKKGIGAEVKIEEIRKEKEGGSEIMIKLGSEENKKG